MLYRDIRIQRFNRSPDHISQSVPMRILQNVRECKTVISPKLLGYTLGFHTLVFLFVNEHGEIGDLGESIGKNWAGEFFKAFEEGQNDYKFANLKLPNSFAEESSSLITNSNELSLRRVQSEGVLVKKLSIKLEKQLNSSNSSRRRLKTESGEKRRRGRSPSLSLKISEKFSKVNKSIQSSFRSFIPYQF
ncbi:Oidioi.mRNA.OKI2018_I69.chr1.g3883.t1.cds [Oikopleura dioica]|uniref:Oidioi.mRNA.OKI2018_I69.chr1.g3883.t1.cds n=1 Tax=Oikopleura dioica TaxID=34765 RepID=A0ABN7SVJ2_OIKDI|nr:Oidioi.mRNA.OKI2018_I69.chr1.g3883.t1.cds [Oikopleura dioica]